MEATVQHIIDSRVDQFRVQAHFRFADLHKLFSKWFLGGVANFKGTAVNLAEMWQRVPPRALFHSLVVM
jgi:hypothetical protein